MKKVLSFIFVSAYGIIASYLLWLAFHLAIPWLMSFGWIAVIVYVLFFFGFITSLFGGLGALLLLPIAKYIDNAPSSVYVPIVFFIIHGISSAREPWLLDMEYTLVKYVIGGFISLTAVSIYISLLSLLVKIAWAKR